MRIKRLPLSAFKVGILSLLPLVLFSCRPSINVEELVFLTPDIEIDMLSDSTFFSEIGILLSHQGDIYMSTPERVQLVRMDKDLNLKNTIGRQGRGPQELLFFKSFLVTDDEVWIGDPNVSAFRKFTPEGQFIATETKSQNHYNNIERCAIEGDKIYFSDPNHDTQTSLSMLDLAQEDDSLRLRRFGTLTDFNHPSKSVLMNRSHIFIDQDYLIVVPLSIPVIQKYDKNTLELVETFDLMQISNMKGVYNHAISTEAAKLPNASYGLISDAYLHNNLLYIASFTSNNMPKDERSDFYGVMVFDISGTPRYVKRYLCKDFIHQLCVTDDYLYTSPGRGLLKRYPLP